MTAAPTRPPKTYNKLLDEWQAACSVKVRDWPGSEKLERVVAVNSFVLKHIRKFELLGVLMRISSFSLVSWLGPDSPFMFVWVFNTIDALILAWCSILKKDLAYSLLNVFWVIIGVIGILRAAGVFHY